MENKNYYIAVDLGSSKVVVLVAQKSPSGLLDLVDCEVVPVPSQGFVRGEIKNIELVSKALSQAIAKVEERLGIKIKQAFAGISGQNIKSAKHSYFVYVGSDGEIVQQDVIKLQESMNNVQAPESETILKILPQKYIIDQAEHVSNPVGMFGKRLEAIFNFILASKLSVDRFKKALTKVGIEQKAMYLNPLVTAQAVVLPEEADMGVAVVDIGAGTTDLTIYHENSIVHLAVIPMGAEAINRDLKEHGIMERFIENIKIQYGNAISDDISQEKFVKIPGTRTHKEVCLKNIVSIIEARMRDIIDFVVAEIKSSGYEDKLASGIVLTGGCSKLMRIDELVKDMTGYEVRLASAESVVEEESKELASDRALSTAIGIAYQAVMEEQNPYTYSVAKMVAVEPEPEKPQQVETKPKQEKKPIVIVEPEEDEVEQPEIEVENKKEKKKFGKFFSMIKDKLSDMLDVLEDADVDNDNNSR